MTITPNPIFKELTFANAPADADVIVHTFQTFLGRDPSAAAIEAYAGKNFTAQQFEHLLSETAEFRASGRILSYWDRSKYDPSRLIIGPAKLLYCPIAKVANTSIKEWLVRLNGFTTLEHAGAVHSQIDTKKLPFNMGNWSYSSIDGLRHKPDWSSVAVLRDPIERLVSCYWDKFVRYRNDALTLKFHTAPVYRHFNGGNEPTPDQINRGITFRQLCIYINDLPREAMDSHWAPQFEYLKNSRCDHLFNINNISAFEDFVRSRLPENLQNVRLGMHNSAPKVQSGNHDTNGFCDTPPNQLDDVNKPPTSAFITPDIKSFVEDYYALDFKLLETAV